MKKLTKQQRKDLAWEKYWKVRDLAEEKYCKVEDPAREKLEKEWEKIDEEKEWKN